MKTFTIICVTALIFFDFARAGDDEEEEFKCEPNDFDQVELPKGIKCAKENDVTSEELDKNMDDDEENPFQGKKKCVYRCYMGNKGWLTTTHDVIIQNVKEFVTQAYKDEIRDQALEVVEDCAEMTPREEEEECDFHSEFGRCIRRKMRPICGPLPAEYKKQLMEKYKD